MPIFNAIWNDFNNPIPGVIKKSVDGYNIIDEKELKYWQPPDDPQQNVIDFIKSNSGSGACGAWSQLLMYSFLIQGFQTSDIAICEIKSSENPGGREMLVKNWIFNEPGMYQLHTPFKYAYTIDLNEDPSGGVEAQGMPNPVLKRYSNHFVVKFNNIYYDPSYGSGPFINEIQWEDSSLDGFLQAFEGIMYWLGKKDVKLIQETTFTIPN